MKKDIIEDSLICLANAKLNDTSYEVARDITLDYITDLQERFNVLLEAHKIADELEQEKQDRIDKAIEYIEDNSTNTYLLKSFDIDILLNILQGEE